MILQFEIKSQSLMMQNIKLFIPKIAPPSRTDAGLIAHCRRTLLSGGHWEKMYRSSPRKRVGDCVCLDGRVSTLERT